MHSTTTSNRQESDMDVKDSLLLEAAFKQFNFRHGINLMAVGSQLSPGALLSTALHWGGPATLYTVHEVRLACQHISGLPWFIMKKVHKVI